VATVASVINQVKHTLHTTGGGWPDAELISYVAEAQVALCQVKPNALTRRINFNMAVGYIQELPQDTNKLLTIPTNLSGERVAVVLESELNASRRGWRAEELEAAGHPVINYMYDSENPYEFLVYPPRWIKSIADEPERNANEIAAKRKLEEDAKTDGKYGTLEIIYARIPTVSLTPSDFDTELEVRDIYFSSIVNYTLYKAYSQEAVEPGLVEKARLYLNRFYDSLGVKQQNEYMSHPWSRIARASLTEGGAEGVGP